MTSTLLKYNVILIVLSIGITLIHNSSGEKVKINIDLYYDPISPPCRAVLLTLEALNLEVNLIYTNIFANELFKDNFFKLNSLHAIPIIRDGDFVLSESHAIITYLVQEYGGKVDHPLYPDNLKTQSNVDQRLHYDNTYLYPAFKAQYIPWIFFRIQKTGEREKKIHEALEYLESILKKSPWTAGESMTVADFSLVASISTFKVAGVNLQKYDKINEWLTKCTYTMNGYKEANQNGINIFETTLKSLDEKFGNLTYIEFL